MVEISAEFEMLNKLTRIQVALYRFLCSTPCHGIEVVASIHFQPGKPHQTAASNNLIHQGSRHELLDPHSRVCNTQHLPL